MMNRRLLSGLLRASRSLAASGSLAATSAVEVAAPKASQCLSSFLPLAARSLHTSTAPCFSASHDDDAPAVYDAAAFNEPERKFRSLGDKELWHEAWMYEDRFGSETDPIHVPSLEVERIIGVTDPEDESLIVWGILKAGEPPRQFIEGGEYYLLKVVPQVKKVGDILLELEAHKTPTPVAA